MGKENLNQGNLVHGQAIDPEELLRTLPEGYGFVAYRNGGNWHLYGEPKSQQQDLDCLMAGAGRMYGKKGVRVFIK